jgi:hypothetical protein
VFERGRQRFVYLWKAEGAVEILTWPAAKRRVTLVDIMGQRKEVKALNGRGQVPLSTDPTVVYGLDLKHFSGLTEAVRPLRPRFAGSFPTVRITVKDWGETIATWDDGTPALVVSQDPQRRVAFVANRLPGDYRTAGSKTAGSGRARPTSASFRRAMRRR